jgi:hypothetical protein
MPEVSQSSNDHPEPHWLGTFLAMLRCLVLMVNAFRHDAELKRSENDRQETCNECGGSIIYWDSMAGIDSMGWGIDRPLAPTRLLIAQSLHQLQ